MYRIYIETSGNKPLIFGGGSPDMSASEDLSGVQGVQFVSGTRSGNTVIADLAKQQGVLWFTSHGQWGSRSYENIAPGDAIFFDWDLDGSADHVGLVIGTDGSRVYKVLIVTRSEKDKCLNLRISNILLYTSGTVIGYTINCKDKIHPCICKGNFHG